MSHEERYAVAVGERGRVVLPAALRQQLGIQPGDRLILTVESDGGFHAVTARELAHQAFGMYRQLAPGRSLVDELIAERREEARREERP